MPLWWIPCPTVITVEAGETLASALAKKVNAPDTDGESNYYKLIVTVTSKNPDTTTTPATADAIVTVAAKATEPTKYELKYVWNGGKAATNAVYTPDGQYAAGADIDVPTKDEAVREGYTFAGWYTDEGLNQKWTTGDKMPASNLTLYANWEQNPPEPTTGSVVITKEINGVDEKNIKTVTGFDFNVEGLDAEGNVIIAGTGSLGYDGTKLTTAVIDLRAGTYTLSEDLIKAKSAIPGYELVGVRFVETGKESESAVQTDTDDGYGDYDLTITAGGTVYVTCINTYKKTETEPTYTVTYIDGVNGSAFKDQVYKDLHLNDKTPAFDGTPPPAVVIPSLAGTPLLRKP